MTTEPKRTVHQAVLDVMAAIGAVGKGSMQQGFAFRGIDAVLNSVSPAMRDHGLTVHPAKVEHRRGDKAFSGGNKGAQIDVIVDYVFTGPDGSTFTAQVAAEATDVNDKATAKAMSVALRTCLIQTFAIPTEESGPDWQSLFETAKSRGKDALVALRHQGKAAGAPEGMFKAIEDAIAALPIEGKVQ
ncbi:ERF family ssDNA binding protein [Arthrobacter phage Shoya]|uniref:ERF family ssDNA binding protein n=1 Tax=Arthrobacter phage Shoya TaxID=2704035 RepID=A0A6G6XI82_9CAUD|nr:ERF family ssDNA binding protein [Arthrobacter phage Shoya]QIG57724.1 ERF family ssDNA binding protein [Arthrobacter phage Shoya]